jgi:hypothetical protein
LWPLCACPLFRRYRPKKSLGRDPFEGLKVDTELAKRGSLLDRAEALEGVVDDQLVEEEDQQASKRGGQAEDFKDGYEGAGSSGSGERDEEDTGTSGPISGGGFSGSSSRGGKGGLPFGFEMVEPLSARLSASAEAWKGGSPKGSMRRRKSAIIAKINIDEVRLANDQAAAALAASVTGGGGPSGGPKSPLTPAMEASSKRERFLRQASTAEGRKSLVESKLMMSQGGTMDGLGGHGTMHGGVSSAAVASAVAASAVAAQAVAAGMSGDLKAHGSALAALAELMVAQEGEWRLRGGVRDRRTFCR